MMFRRYMVCHISQAALLCSEKKKKDFKDSNLKYLQFLTDPVLPKLFYKQLRKRMDI